MNTVFRESTACGSIEVYRRFGGTHSLHLQLIKQSEISFYQTADVTPQKIPFFVVTAESHLE
jgi:hypothetical protein